MQLLCNYIRDSLEGEEVLLDSPDTDAQSAQLVRIIGQRQTLGDKPVRHFKESSGEIVVLLVALDCMQHRGNQRCTHDGQILIDRIDQTHCLSLRIILREHQKVKVCRAEEGIMHRFIQPLRAQPLLQAHFSPLSYRKSACRNAGALQKSRLDVFITVHPDHFFRDIRIILNIRTVSRNMQCQFIAIDRRIKLQVLHDAKDILFRYSDSEDTVHLLHRDFHLGRLYRVAGVAVTVGL